MAEAIDNHHVPIYSYEVYLYSHPRFLSRKTCNKTLHSPSSSSSGPSAIRWCKAARREGIDVVLKGGSVKQAIHPCNDVDPVTDHKLLLPHWGRNGAWAVRIIHTVRPILNLFILSGVWSPREEPGTSWSFESSCGSGSFTSGTDLVWIRWKLRRVYAVFRWACLFQGITCWLVQ